MPFNESGENFSLGEKSASITNPNKDFSSGEKSAQNPFDSLSNDGLEEIFRYFKPQQLVRLSHVCSRWRSVANMRFFKNANKLDYFKYPENRSALLCEQQRQSELLYKQYYQSANARLWSERGEQIEKINGCLQVFGTDYIASKNIFMEMLESFLIWRYGKKTNKEIEKIAKAEALAKLKGPMKKESLPLTTQSQVVPKSPLTPQPLSTPKHKY